jgi:hypothetical protein
MKHIKVFVEQAILFSTKENVFLNHIKVFFPDIDRKRQKKQISAISINFFWVSIFFHLNPPSFLGFLQDITENEAVYFAHNIQ